MKVIFVLHYIVGRENAYFFINLNLLPRRQFKGFLIIYQGFPNRISHLAYNAYMVQIHSI